ncbi:MAG: stage V sporulation protein D [Clostridia bacterium]|nr:stage V sporulation protein D [Clostridia bacterium]
MYKTNTLSLLRKRLLVVVTSVASLFFILFGRLCYIQLVDGKELQAKATSQWYRDLPLTAKRGIIYDSCGEVLADNKDVYTIYVRPNAVKDFNAVTTVLSEILGLDYQTLYQKITAKRVSEITIKRQVPSTTAEIIKQCGVDGIYYAIDSQRNYPQSSLLSQVLGYTDIDNNGQSGLEAYYDKYLKGVNGMVYTETDIKGTQIQGTTLKYVPSIAGCDVSLTIDAQIQSFAQSAVNNALVEWNAKSAGMIVMDVNSGAIVGMAMAPNFDLNAVPRNDIETLNQLSKNTMLVDVYEPGSTFKIFTTAIALSEGVTNESAQFYCPGYRIVDGQRIKCWRYIGHGNQTLGDGVKNSCNCVFMDLAQKLGTDKLYDGLRNFGFGKKTGVDFYGESSGIMMKQSQVKTVDLARIGFGQAVAVTPLQLITAVSAVANGGTLYEPYFVSKISSQSKTVFVRQPTAVRKVLDKETCSLVSSMLEKVVSEGGGSKAGVEGFKIAGKTGTAQKYGDGGIAQGKYISSFVGYAPADNPKYAVLMLVDEPNSYAYYGSIVAAPYAGEVFRKIFDYKGMVAESEDVEYTVMPELCGLPLTEATVALKECGVYYEMDGEGKFVSSTVPVAGTKIKKNEVVYIKITDYS